MRNILLFFLVLFLSCQVMAQQGRISGTVIDGKDGTPMIGANVQIKGTTNGAITDLDGKFSLNVTTNNAVLLVSSVGYKPQSFKIGSKRNFEITLEENSEVLNEVVVIGYGTMKKKDLTGSVGSITGDKLKETVTANLDQALQGKIAGVQVTSNSGTPGAATTIRIRGASSLSSDNEPLYVIDGVQMSGAGSSIAGFDWAGGSNGQNKVNPLAAISPSDIVSIDVLKDASACAIYGSAGANGVILVTTRRGVAGKVKISYDGYAAASVLPKKLDMMNLSQFAGYQKYLCDDWGTTLSDYYKDPSLLGNGQDWQDAIFKTAWMQSHSLSVSGGTDKIKFAASGGWLDQDGIVIGSNFNRFNSRFNFDAQARSWLTLGGSLAFSRSNEKITLNDGGDGVIMQSLLMPPSVPVYDLDGNYAGPESVEGVSCNPVAVAMTRNNTLLRNRIMGNFYASINLYKDLNFHVEYTFDGSNNTNKAFYPTYEWGALKNEINRIMERDDQSYFWSQSDYFTWKHTFAKKHNLSVMAGFEAQESSWEGTQLIKKNLTTDDIQEIGIDGTYETNTGWKDRATKASYYGRLNYDFSDKYYVTATLRRDASSKFGANNRWGTFPSVAGAWRISNESFLRGNKTISNLKLRLGYGLVGNDNIGTYKWGSAMTAETTPFGTSYRATQISNPDLKWESSVQYNLGVDLGLFNNRIELTADVYYKTTKDLLMQISVPSYLGGSTSDDIAAPYANVGKIDNKGFDITLNTRNIESKNFTWSSNINFSLNRGKVKELNDEDQAFYGAIDWYSEFQTATITKVGQPIGVFYGYKSEGLFKDKEDILNHAVQKADPQNSKINYVNKTGGVWVGDVKFKDQNNDGVIDTDDQVIIGNPNPDFTFGFNNNMTYKDFDLQFSVIGSVGGDVLNFSKTFTEGQTSLWYNQSVNVLNHAQYGYYDTSGSTTDPDNVYLANPSTSIPRATSTDVNRNNRMSDRFIENGSYVRLSSITLGYSLPKSWLTKLQIERFRIYASAQNLWTITGYSGYDPEIGAYNQSSMKQNIDMGHYPTPRMFTFGVNVGF
jgi:TonB-dependent starch-binding outer membrane protein SusC